MAVTTGLTLWAYIGPLVGIAFGHWLSRSWQFKQWKLENRRQEYREVLSALAVAYTMMQRYIVEAKRGESDAGEIPTLTEVESRLEQAKLESFRRSA